MSNEPRISTTASMTITGGLTAATLLTFAQSVPPDARVSINVDRGGGQMDPGSTTITAAWAGGAKAPFTLPQSSTPGAR
jgi:hypothetical protein